MGSTHLAIGCLSRPLSHSAHKQKWINLFQFWLNVLYSDWPTDPLPVVQVEEKIPFVLIMYNTYTNMCLTWPTTNDFNTLMVLCLVRFKKNPFAIMINSLTFLFVWWGEEEEEGEEKKKRFSCVGLVHPTCSLWRTVASPVSFYTSILYKEL